jgi:MFS family permease
MYQSKRYAAWIVFGVAFGFIIHLILRFVVEAYVAKTDALNYLDANQLAQFYRSVFIPHLIASLFIGLLFGIWSAYQGLRFKTWEDRFLRKFSLMRGHYIVLTYIGIFLIAFGIGSFFGDFFTGLSWWFILLGAAIELPFALEYIKEDKE